MKKKPPNNETATIEVMTMMLSNNVPLILIVIPPRHKNYICHIPSSNSVARISYIKYNVINKYFIAGDI